MSSAFDLTGMQKLLYNNLLEIVVAVKDGRYGTDNMIDIDSLQDDIDECIDECVND